MVKLLVYDSGVVDLEAPILMTEEQRKKFIDFFEENVSDVSVKEVEEPIKNMGEREYSWKSWSIGEYTQLLGPATNEELSNTMSRSIMSVQMQRGAFVPNFISWCKKNRHDIPQGNDLLKLIELYREVSQ